MSGDPNETATPSPARKSFFQKTVLLSALTLVTLAFAGMMVAGIAFLQIRASAEKAPEIHPPLSVETRPYRIEAGYRQTSDYVGRLEPNRQTLLAFERAGLVIEVKKDEGDEILAEETAAALDTALLKAGRRQAEAQKRELQARRRLAELTLQRARQLRNEGWTPEQRFDEAEASVAELTAAIERIDARIASIDIDVDKSILRAPFNGVVAERSIDEGAVVSAGTPVMTVLESGKRQVRIGLPPEEAAGLDPRAAYRFRSGATIFTGTLSAKRPDIQPGTRTATALFDVTGADGIPFGEIVTLQLETVIDQPGGWVPLSSLKEGRKGLWSIMTVVTRDGGTHVQNEAVQVLYAEGQSVFVRGTLEDGAAIIVNGGNRVTDGQRVALADQE